MLEANLLHIRSNITVENVLHNISVEKTTYCNGYKLFNTDCSVISLLISVSEIDEIPHM